METNELLKKYEESLKFSRIPYDAKIWIIVSIIITLIIGLITTTITIIILEMITLVPIAFSAATIVLMLGYPLMKKERIIDNIEYNFGDALKQMADILKAGDTYERALREIVESDYGRLSEEMEIALRRLEEGANIETALKGFSERIDSRLVKRTIIIILDSIRTGSGLANVLEDFAEDVKESYRLKESRRANTTMQFMFMIAAGGFIAPLIFGQITSILNLFSKITTETLFQEGIPGTENITIFIVLLIQAYLIIEVIASGIIMSIVRDGRFGKSIIYIPILLVIAYIIYHLATFLLGIMLLGAL